MVLIPFRLRIGWFSPLIHPLLHERICGYSIVVSFILHRGREQQVFFVNMHHGTTFPQVIVEYNLFCFVHEHS